MIHCYNKIWFIVLGYTEIYSILLYAVKQIVSYQDQPFFSLFDEGKEGMMKLHYTYVQPNPQTFYPY